MLHITSGDAVNLEETGLAGEFLRWRDALHEGPVPAGISGQELNALRAGFLADTCRLAPEDVLSGFEHRDRVIASSAEHDEVILWFEHDLYDQLQLIQALDQFAALHCALARLSLICTDRYLGPMPPADLRELFPSRHTVSRSEVETARQAWAAFRAPSPESLLPIANGADCALPFLPGAMLRHLQEFPSVRNGLSRTQSQLLRSLAAAGPQPPHELFQSNGRQEERIYLGDVFFYRIVEELVTRPVPLVEQRQDLLAITEAGRGVLGGHADQIALSGINRWLGGVHLQTGNVWRWDDGSRTITPAT